MPRCLKSLSPGTPLSQVLGRRLALSAVAWQVMLAQDMVEDDMGEQVSVKGGEARYEENTGEAQADGLRVATGGAEETGASPWAASAMATASTSLAISALLRPGGEAPLLRRPYGLAIPFSAPPSLPIPA